MKVIKSYLQVLLEKLGKFIPAIEEGKQDKLVSGENIKTINNVSILGPGNIDTGDIIVVEDNLESDSPTHALSARQGKVLKGMIDNKRVYVLNNVLMIEN